VNRHHRDPHVDPHPGDKFRHLGLYVVVTEVGVRNFSRSTYVDLRLINPGIGEEIVRAFVPLPPWLIEADWTYRELADRSFEVQHGPTEPFTAPGPDSAR